MVCMSWIIIYVQIPHLNGSIQWVFRRRRYQAVINIPNMSSDVHMYHHPVILVHINWNKHVLHFCKGPRQIHLVYITQGIDDLPEYDEHVIRQVLGHEILTAFLNIFCQCFCFREHIPCQKSVGSTLMDSSLFDGSFLQQSLQYSSISKLLSHCPVLRRRTSFDDACWCRAVGASTNFSQLD